MTTEGPLAGKAAIVTGASRGIGRAVARRLAELGAQVGTIQRSPVEGLAVRADLAVPEEAEHAVEELARRLGRIDVCVCNAGVIHRRPALDVSIEDWQRVIDVNLTGAFVVSRAAARRMVAQGTGGAIVHVASQLCFFGGVNVASYAASKGGVAQLAKSQSNEWAPFGIRVNAVAPGWVETEMTEELRANEKRYREITGRIPLGRWATDEEIAEAVAWLCSPASSYVAGIVLPVDGGYLAR